MNTGTIDPRINDLLIQCVVDTLKDQCDMTVSAGEPSTLTQAPSKNSDITAKIEFKSVQYEGTVALRFPREQLLKTMNKMLKENHPTLTPVLESGATELLNLTFSKAKRKLNNRGYGIDKALPVLVNQGDFSNAKQQVVPSTEVPFTTEFGAFFLSVALKS